MYAIMDRLKNKRNRESTRNNYHAIWRLFSKFVLKLDKKPESWEDRIYLFLTYLVNSGKKSSTVRSYFSALKAVLQDDDIKFQIDENSILLKSITRACKLTNDRVKTRLPIHLKLLEVLLFEVERLFATQPYLCTLYQALLSMAYYGLFRIGELVNSDHVAKAKDVLIAVNKRKLLFILFSSKTHGKESRPQKIKIAEAKRIEKSPGGPAVTTPFRHFCPFDLATKFLRARGVDYYSVSEPFFVYRDHSPVEAEDVRKTLATLLKQINLNPTFYSFHSLRAGRVTDMAKWGFTVDQIKQIGRWKSNAVYRYLKY